MFKIIWNKLLDEKELNEQECQSLRTVEGISFVRAKWSSFYEGNAEASSELLGLYSRLYGTIQNKQTKRFEQVAPIFSEYWVDAMRMAHAARNGQIENLQILVKKFPKDKVDALLMDAARNYDIEFIDTFLKADVCSKEVHIKLLTELVKNGNVENLQGDFLGNSSIIFGAPLAQAAAAEEPPSTLDLEALVISGNTPVFEDGNGC